MKNNERIECDWTQKKDCAPIYVYECLGVLNSHNTFNRYLLWIAMLSFLLSCFFFIFFYIFRRIIIFPIV